MNLDQLISNISRFWSLVWWTKNIADTSMSSSVRSEMSHEQAHSKSHAHSYSQEGVKCAGQGDEIGVASSDVTGECCSLNFFCVSGWMRYV